MCMYNFRILENLAFLENPQSFYLERKKDT